MELRSVARVDSATEIRRTDVGDIERRGAAIDLRHVRVALVDDQRCPFAGVNRYVVPSDISNVFSSKI